MRKPHYSGNKANEEKKDQSGNDKIKQMQGLPPGVRHLRCTPTEQFDQADDQPCQEEQGNETRKYCKRNIIPNSIQLLGKWENTIVDVYIREKMNRVPADSGRGGWRAARIRQEPAQKKHGCIRISINGIVTDVVERIQIAVR